MSSKVPETNYDAVGVTFPWREYLSSKGWSADMKADMQGMSCTMVIDIAGTTDLSAAIAGILGYPSIEGNRISRKLPMRHPRFPWLRAETISGIQGVKFLSLDAKAQGHGPVTSYLIWRLTIAFRALPFDLLENAETVKEHYRYVIKQQEWAVDFLSKEMGKYRFHPETPHAEPGSTPFREANAIVNGKATRINAKCRHVWKWLHVPVAFVMNDEGIPKNILDTVGKVNDLPFPGGENFPSHTLLCEGPKFEPVVLPVAPSLLGIPNPFAAPMVLNITIQFVWYDPPRDANFQSLERGHLLVPHPTNKFYYPIETRVGADPLYERADFNKMFEMVE